MPKNILFICKGHQNIAGAQLYLQHIEKTFPPETYRLHFAFQFRDGTRVFDEIELERPLKRWEYDWRHLNFYNSYRQALSLYRQINPDFIIFNSNEDEIIPPLLAALICGIKSKIMVVHWALDESSLPFISKNNRFRFPIPSRYALKTRLKRFLAYSCLDKLIFVNTVTRKAFEKLYKVSPGKCMTIYNGIDVSTFRLDGKTRAETRASLGVLSHEIMLLATGNLSPVKGHSVLVESIAELVSQGCQVKCFIAGQGELQESLEALIDGKKIARECKLLGYRNDIPQLLAATDIFCMPSLNEALGFSIIEAMCAGKPVVASRVGGIPEVITDSVEGFLVQPGSSAALTAAIITLMRDAQLRTDMGRNGIHKSIEKFSKNTMIKMTAEFLGVN